MIEVSDLQLTGAMDMDPDPVVQVDCEDVKLYEILEHRKYGGGNPIHYLYDYGDNWEHIILCTARASATDYFECLDGEGHPAAEDCGGVGAWEELIEAYKTYDEDPNECTDDQLERMEWYREDCSNGNPLGLGDGRVKQWDKDQINEQLRQQDIC
jgi:hypothetical protein